MIEAEYQEFELTEIARRMASIVRLGIVAEVDHQAARVRVRYGGEGETALSAWLPWVTERAGQDRSWWPPEAGEQVLILAPSGEMAKGVAVGGVYRREHPAPESDPNKHAIHYSDGAVIEYDRSAHRLKAELPAGGGAELTADGGVTITGDVTITGEVTVDGGIDATGDIDAEGNVTVGGDVEDSKGSMDEMRGVYNSHTHGVPPGVVVPMPNQRMT